MPAIIDLTEVSLTYEGPVRHRALRDISLRIHRGEWVSIEGPSGGGKSTLLNVIALLDKPTGGRYLINGQDVAEASEIERARIRSDSFGFIFQNFHLLERRRVAESVELGLLYRGVAAAERRRRAISALGAVGLASLADRPVNTLSGGQRQRVAVARALASATPIVVADEPTGNLDTESGRHVIEALSTLHRAGTTVILVTHSPEIAAHAQRHVRIIDGRLEEIPGRTSRSGGSRSLPPETGPPGDPSKLKLRDVASDAASSLRSRVGRSAALLFAVAAGIGLTLATIGVSQSAQAQVATTFDMQLNRHVTVGWPPGSDLTSEIADSLVLERVQDIPGVDDAGLLFDLGDHRLQVSEARDAFSVGALAASPDIRGAAELTVSWSPEGERPILAGEVLIGQSLAEQLDLGTLDSSPTVLLDGRSVAVAGVIARSPRLPNLLGQVLLSVEDATQVGAAVSGQVLIRTRAGAAQAVARTAPIAVDPFEPATLTVEAPTDPRELRTEIEGSVQLALAVVSIATLLGAAISLANAMSSAIAERRAEFGLRRAVGALPRHVSSLVFIESSTIGLLGGGLGLGIGFAVILTTTLVNQWAPVFDMRLAPLAILGGVSIGFLGGIAATVRALRIQPSAALRA